MNINIQHFRKTICRYGIIIYMIMIYLAHISAQDVYQASVNEGISFKSSALVDFWRSDLITDKKAISIGIDIEVNYGLTEQFSIFGGYQSTLSTSLNAKEISFLLYTKGCRHQNFITGISYMGGSTSSKLRYNLSCGAMFNSTNISINSLEFNNLQEIKLKGLGLYAGIGIAYYLTPFFSTDCNISYNIGRYQSSEYLGIKYKEAIQWNRLQPYVGVAYHFSGR